MSDAEFFFSFLSPVKLLLLVLNTARTSYGKTSAVRDGFLVCLIGQMGGTSGQLDLGRNWIR